MPLFLQPSSRLRVASFFETESLPFAHWMSRQDFSLSSGLFHRVAQVLDFLPF